MLSHKKAFIHSLMACCTGAAAALSFGRLRGLCVDPSGEESRVGTDANTGVSSV